MQRADGVVKLLATFVVAAHALAQHLEQPDIGDLTLFFLRRRDRQRLQGVEQAPGVTVSVGDQPVDCYFFYSW